MARIYGLAGAIVRFTKTDEEFERHGEPPQFDDLLKFDADTNATVVNGLNTDWNAHTLSGGVLQRSGQTVSIAAPGESYLARRQATAAEEKARELLSGLAQLDVLDFGYAYVARTLARANGESLATIQAIVDRPTAGTYVQSMDQFTNVTTAQRQWLIVDLESRAIDAALIRLFLT